MRGRNPAGPEFVEKLKGSDKAKRRARVVLEMLAGQCRVPEACHRLGIKEARLDQLRLEGLQAMVTELEDKPAGRPARTPTPADLDNEHLRAEIERLQAELNVALVRAELAVGLPRVGAKSKKNDAPAASVPNEDKAPRLNIPSEEAIVAHVKKLISNEPVAEGPPRHDFPGQRADRDNEQIIRGHVVATGQGLVEQGWSWTEAAGLLDIPERTLRGWRSVLATRPLASPALGRPVQLALPAQRAQIIDRIDELGPGVGVPTLRTEFPNVTRYEITNILGCCRQEWRWQHRQELQELHWFTPGAAWAVDFHGPRAQPIDGRFPYLLAVRDLASGMVLLWLPITDATARSAIEALEMLFLVHGAPLVLKSDNGSAFIAARLRKLCRRFGVKNLYSPPQTPSYNGSIEATIGSLKIRTERYAAQDGRPSLWTKADADAARHEANTAARPHGPRPDQAWAARPRITQAQRDQFLAAAARRFKNLVANQGPPKDHAQRRATERDTISQVLVELGYLSITRGRTRLPVCKKKVAEMT
jgi:transposase InsO family protein